MADGEPAGDVTIIPRGLVLDDDGRVVFADVCAVRRVAGDRIVTLAGRADDCGTGGDGGPPTRARFDTTEDLARGSDGAVYVADGNACRVRKVASGVVTTVAGTGECGFAGDGGPATEAKLASPRAVVASGSDLFVADMQNCRIRRIRDGKIATVAGTGECRPSDDDSEPATSATFGYVHALAASPDGGVYIAENCRVRRVHAGSITSVVGTGTCGFAGDGGPAIDAEISSVSGLAVGPDGSLYIADSGNCRIRRVDTDGTITTVVGDGNCQWSYVPSAWDSGSTSEGDDRRRATTTTAGAVAEQGGRGDPDHTPASTPPPDDDGSPDQPIRASGTPGGDGRDDGARATVAGDDTGQAAAPPGGPGSEQGAGSGEVDAGEAGRFAAVLLVLGVLAYAAFTFWRRRSPI